MAVSRKLALDVSQERGTNSIDSLEVVPLNFHKTPDHHESLSAWITAKRVAPRLMFLASTRKHVHQNQHIAFIRFESRVGQEELLHDTLAFRPTRRTTSSQVQTQICVASRQPERIDGTWTTSGSQERIMCSVHGVHRTTWMCLPHVVARQLNLAVVRKSA